MLILQLEFFVVGAFAHLCQSTLHVCAGHAMELIHTVCLLQLRTIYSYRSYMALVCIHIAPLPRTTPWLTGFMLYLHNIPGGIPDTHPR